MTEETLMKASGLNNQIKNLQAKRNELLSAQKLCWGNTEDIRGRVFKVSISERGSTRDTAVFVSADAAKEALDRELEEAGKKLTELRKEFSEL